jgi:hypothetical protein
MFLFLLFVFCHFVFFFLFTQSAFEFVLLYGGRELGANDGDAIVDDLNSVIRFFNARGLRLRLCESVVFLKKQLKPIVADRVSKQEHGLSKPMLDAASAHLLQICANVVEQPANVLMRRYADAAPQPTRRTPFDRRTITSTLFARQNDKHVREWLKLQRQQPAFAAVAVGARCFDAPREALLDVDGAALLDDLDAHAAALCHHFDRRQSC